MSNLLKDASILLTPTAYDNGSMHAIKPENGDGDFDFQRNSAATRVNAQGLVENVQIISPELVSNGNFSEIGAEEVLNGNFSQEGSELVTNGDFATDSDWISSDINGFSISGGKLNLLDVAYAKSVLQTNVATVGKTYKVTLEISDYVKGSVRIILGGSVTSTQSSNGVFTFYVTALADANIGIQTLGGGGTTLSIDNVSVKEVGQDWNLGGDWTIGENKIIHPAGSSPEYSTQDNVLTIGKDYTYSVELLTGNGTNFAQLYVAGVGAIAAFTNGAGVYTGSFTAQGTNIRIRALGADIDVEVTNISIKEVGQDWTFGTGWSVDQANSKADATDAAFNSQLANSAAIGASKKYKISFDVSNYVKGNVIVKIGNTSSATVSSNGSFTFTLTSANTSSFQIATWAGSGTTLSVTNVSIKEITDDTNIPRINYEGFSYQDVLGSEEIVNGDFENGSANWSLSDSTVLNGKLNISTTSINNTAQQSITNLIIGASYKIEYNINSILTGGLVVYESSHSRPAYETSAGVYSNTFIATAATQTINVRTSGATTATIDNVSVKEYLGQEVVPDSGCGSWLLEPQSTNLLPYSEDFSQWTSYITTPTLNSATSPSGDVNSAKLTSTGVYGSFSLNISKSSSALNYTQSVFVKAINYTVVNLISYGSSSANRAQVSFDLSDGSVSSAASVNGAYSNPSESIEDYGNGWYRISLSFTSDASVEVRPHIQFPVQMTNDDYVLLWGAQLENQSYSTSYIPTNGATNTRLQDIANNSGNSSLINSTEGVFYAEIKRDTSANTFHLISLNNASSNSDANSVAIGVNGSDLFYVRVKSPNGSYTNQGIPMSIGDFHKVAIRYEQGNIGLFIDGTKEGTFTGAWLFTLPLDNLSFDYNGNGSLKFFGKTKALAVYKEALTDANLRCLTYPNPVATTFDLDFDTIAEQFTFTRGSEATFVNEQGLIESTNQIGPELVTNGDFATDSNWTKGTGWTISGGSANYDGVNAYQLLRQGTANGVVGKTYLVKYDVINNSGVGGIYAKFGGVNLSGYNQNNGSFEFYATAVSTDYIRFTPQLNFTGSIDNVSVKEVISATNTPIIDYSTGAEAFLLEPQSTNLVTDSQNYNSTYWSKQSGVLSDGGVGLFYLSPTSNVIKYEVTQTQYNQMYYKLPSGVTIGNTYTQQGYVKCDDAPYIHFQIHALSGSAYIVWDNVNNTVISADPSIDSYNIKSLSDGWVKAEITFTAAVSSIYASLKTYFSTSSTSNWAGVSVGTIAYQTFVQVENLPYATSYIPTSGASATRNQELCNNATPVINSEEGTLYAEIAALANDSTFRMINISDGTLDNRVEISYSNTDNLMRVICYVNGVTVATKSNISANILNFNKIAFSYKENDFKAYLNGVNVFTDTSGAIYPPNTLNRVDFGIPSVSGFDFFGNTKGLKYYPKALADVQLEDLTTI